MTDLAVFDFHPGRDSCASPRSTLVSRRGGAGRYRLPARSDDAVPQTRLPTAEELRLIREVLDPRSLRDQEVPDDATVEPTRHRPPIRSRRCCVLGSATCSGCATRSCRPVWATSPMPRLTAATANAGGLGILSAGLLSYEELAAAIDDVKARTDRPFGVNLRADQPDVERRIDLLISAGVRVASFALAPRRTSSPSARTPGWW